MIATPNELQPTIVVVEAGPPPYDWKKSVAKGLKAIAVQAGAVVLVALGGWLVDGSAMREAVKDIPGGLLLVPLLSGLGHYLINLHKHKDD